MESKYLASLSLPAANALHHFLLFATKVKESW
jgi:hypothetical protein